MDIDLDLETRTMDLLEREAEASNRTVAQHLGHVLSRRYMELRRICQCGFFVYRATDDLGCAVCGRRICPWCATCVDDRDVCAIHAPGDMGVARHQR